MRSGDEVNFLCWWVIVAFGSFFLLVTTHHWRKMGTLKVFSELLSSIFHLSKCGYSQPHEKLKEIEFNSIKFMDIHGN